LSPQVRPKQTLIRSYVIDLSSGAVTIASLDPSRH
jgi:hypothetical protein